MTEHSFKLPDIGEGIVEAELSEWMVKLGDLVKEDDTICEVTTDKATVEIPAGIGGKVVWMGAAAGDVLAVGSELVRIDTDADATATERDAPASEDEPEPEPQAEAATPPPERPAPAARPAQAASGARARNAAGRPLAAPSVRGRALELGVDLRQLRGTGPAGRILHEDLDAFVARGADPRPAGGAARRHGTEEIRIAGVRRKIAERMALAKRRIPHFSIIEEVDVEALEELRGTLNRDFGAIRGRLTILPFVLRAIAATLRDHPGINAHFDDEGGILTRHEALHCGIATQTDSGLMVPVLRHAEAGSLWDNADEIRRLSEAARDRRIAPDALTGSTLTVTSLGPLGAVATTPIVNHPEVAIVGINKIAVRPVWNGTDFVPRRMMNLSCSFDHRVVDGWVAAQFVARLKALLETPAMLFMELPDG